MLVFPLSIWGLNVGRVTAALNVAPVMSLEIDGEILTDGVIICEWKCPAEIVLHGPFSSLTAHRACALKQWIALQR